MPNIALIIVCSIITIAALGCVISQEWNRRKNHLSPGNACLTHEYATELRQRHHESQARIREVHDSWPIRNPGSLVARVEIPPDEMRRCNLRTLFNG
jgi:predicted transposase YbfD/YdcC